MQHSGVPGCTGNGELLSQDLSDNAEVWDEKGKTSKLIYTQVSRLVVLHLVYSILALNLKTLIGNKAVHDKLHNSSYRQV